MTADGVVVCCHDETLGRLAVSDVNISETNYADLPAFKSQVEFDIMPGAYTQTANDSPVWLKIQDLFAEFGDTVLYSIDLKQASKPAALELYN